MCVIKSNASFCALFRFSLVKALTERYRPKRIKNKYVNRIEVSIPLLFHLNADVERLW